MGGEDDLDAGAATRGELGEGIADTIGHRFDEAGMVVEDADLIEGELGLLGLRQGFDGADDVLAVLAAAGVGLRTSR